MLDIILKIAKLTQQIADHQDAIDDATAARDAAERTIVENETAIRDLSDERAGAMAALQASAQKPPPADEPYTDHATSHPRHTVRMYRDGTRELRDGRNEIILRYPWRYQSSIAARLHDALSTPMTRPQIEAWAGANKIRIDTVIAYLPMLVNLGIVASDGLTWRTCK